MSNVGLTSTYVIYYLSCFQQPHFKKSPSTLKVKWKAVELQLPGNKSIRPVSQFLLKITVDWYSRFLASLPS